jgi:hypothetical protein
MEERTITRETSKQELELMILLNDIAATLRSLNYNLIELRNAVANLSMKTSKNIFI